jgi:hypothetical protein
MAILVMAILVMALMLFLWGRGTTVLTVLMLLLVALDSIDGPHERSALVGVCTS